MELSNIVKEATQLAKEINLEVISCDSRQFFRKMNIWTDKISEEIRNKLPHHLIDNIDPDQKFTAGQRKEETKKKIINIQNKWKLACIVGWTWLYIDTIYKNYTLPKTSPDYEFRKKLELEEVQKSGILYQKLQKIDPIESQKHHPHSTRYIIRALEIYHQTGRTKTEMCKELPVQRPIFMLGIRRDKESTNNLINKRIYQMIQNWLIDEVQSLLNQGYNKNLQSMQWIGYKETIEFLEWKITKEELIQKIQTNTHRLAKKQRTRFRRYINDAKNNPKKNVTYKVFEL